VGKQFGGELLKDCKDYIERRIHEDESASGMITLSSGVQVWV
jgi:hypothetical protein